MRHNARLLLLVVTVALMGCAHKPPTAPTAGPAPVTAPAPGAPAPVPAPETPTDTTRATAPPDTTHNGTSPATRPPSAAPPEPAPETPPPPVESVMSPDERRQTIARIVADTTAAGAAVRKCSGRKLLPDQESVFDTARNLLGQVRGALDRDELWRAESLARKARQLASSLNCPG
jgi:hypothetical protein